MRIVSVNLKGDLTKALLAALDVLKKGGVVAYPTDTIYGLGANACDYKAVEQVFKIKNRPFSKPLPIIARDLNWVRELAYLPPKLEKLLAEIWPGSITAILTRKDIVPPIVTAGSSKVGVRIPDFEFTEKLLAKFGYPLTATSANLSGEEGTGNIAAVINFFKDQLWQPDLIIDAGNLPKSLPSTILDLSTLKPKILRVGPTKPDFLMKLLGATYAEKANPKRSAPPAEGY
ncbi:MAG: L-threonylcarbamoyladenylate synthase [Patescibacteria group bacterium]